jgi:hypothetical protein
MWRRSVLTTSAVTLFVGAGITLWRLWKVRRSPTYSLAQLARAVAAKDRLAVEQYVDVRRVAQASSRN